MSDLLVLIDLNSRAHFAFPYFPDKVRTQRRVNYQQQDTTIGTKPLMYGGRDPKVLTFPELWLDESDTNRSLAAQLDALEAFTTKEVDGRGAPAALLATWGDRTLRCVLSDLTVEEQLFTKDGEPIRASLTIELTEIQGESETSVIGYTIKPPGT